MTPGSFDIETAKEFVGDEATRVIEGKARADADAGNFDQPAYGDKPTSYWGGVSEEMPRVVYTAAYQKRLARIQRMAERQQLQPA